MALAELSCTCGASGRVEGSASRVADFARDFNDEQRACPPNRIVRLDGPIGIQVLAASQRETGA